MGLWAGVMAERAGIRTLLVEKERIGAGASGGVLGALMPYMPDKWDDKKQFQFDALLSLESEIAAIEAQTGLSAGYRRSGRIMPLPKPHLREIALRHSRDAEASWQSGDRRFFWHVRDRFEHAGWPAPDCMAAGFVHDTLAARVSPRGLLALLCAFLRQSGHVRVEEGTCVERFEPERGRAVLSNGAEIRFGHAILAGGVGTFPLLADLLPDDAPRPGVAVKGQAALLKADVDPQLPVIFLDGLYIVPHEDGHVAIGSTSENSFSDPFRIDGQLEKLVSQARRMVPALETAPVVECWAGLRPKAIGRDPMTGRHPHHDNLSVLTGGFKISFGLAHRLARIVMNEIRGAEAEDMPQSFGIASHFDLLNARAAEGKTA